MVALDHSPELAAAPEQQVVQYPADELVDMAPVQWQAGQGDYWLSMMVLSPSVWAQANAVARWGLGHPS